MVRNDYDDEWAAESAKLGVITRDIFTFVLTNEVSGQFLISTIS